MLRLCLCCDCACAAPVLRLCLCLWCASCCRRLLSARINVWDKGVGTELLRGLVWGMGCGGWAKGYGNAGLRVGMGHVLRGGGLRAKVTSKVYGGAGLRGRYRPWGGGSRLWAWAMGCGASG